jgi:hypothetical protein
MPDSERTYTLTFCAPVSIFTGLGIAGLIDRTVVRDANGLPYPRFQRERATPFLR